MKVRCINALNFKDLTLGKEYPVIEEEPQEYKILNDAESYRRYHKSQFEKVEDALMVECTNKLCEQNEKGECTFYKDTSYCQLKAAYEFGLALEISPHTPSYAEEQLKHAIEQDNKKGQTKSINYEEEYKKLKSENDKYREVVNDFNRCLEKLEEENKKSKYQYEESQQHIINLEHQLKENKEKLDNYKAIKSLMKILSEGL